MRLDEDTSASTLLLVCALLVVGFMIGLITSDLIRDTIKELFYVRR